MPNLSLNKRAARRAEARGRALTIADLQRNPSQLVTPTDLAELKIVCSYAGLKRGLKSGAFPKPLRDPMNGRALRWLASDILAALGLMPDAEQAATT